MQLKLVRSYAIRCYGCNAWVGRFPQWDNCELGKGWQCTKCGTTSTTSKEGRAFGPRSRQWDQLVEEFEEIMESIGPNEYSYREWILSTVIVAEGDG